MHSSSRFSPVHQLATWLNNEIATLYPGCFALVMACRFRKLHPLDSRSLANQNMIAGCSLLPSLFVRVLCDCFKSRRRLESEILVLRHLRNVVLQLRTPRRLYLTRIASPLRTKLVFGSDRSPS